MLDSYILCMYLRHPLYFLSSSSSKATLVWPVLVAPVRTLKSSQYDRRLVYVQRLERLFEQMVKLFFGLATCVTHPRRICTCQQALVAANPGDEAVLRTLLDSLQEDFVLFTKPGEASGGAPVFLAL